MWVSRAVSTSPSADVFFFFCAQTTKQTISARGKRASCLPLFCSAGSKGTWPIRQEIRGHEEDGRPAAGASKHTHRSQDVNREILSADVH